MSEMQIETQPAPVRRPRRAAVAQAPATESATEAALPVECHESPGAPSEPSPAAKAAPGVAPAAEVAVEPAPATEAPPAPTRRGRRGPMAAITLDLALPGVRTAEILAELDRRQRQVTALLAERKRVLREMEEIEAALETIAR